MDSGGHHILATAQNYSDCSALKRHILLFFLLYLNYFLLFFFRKAKVLISARFKYNNIKMVRKSTLIHLSSAIAL